jgi:hypothetical protein
MRCRCWQVVLVGVVWIILLGGCGEDGVGGTNNRPVWVGDAIEGTYAVLVSSELIGELTLQNGKYSFTSIPNSPDGEFELFFSDHPEGKYKIDRYYGSISVDSDLMKLEDDEILLKFTFISGDSERGFLVRNDRENKEVYFHSLVSELVIWEIHKSWYE